MSPEFALIKLGKDPLLESQLLLKFRDRKAHPGRMAESGRRHRF